MNDAAAADRTRFARDHADLDLRVARLPAPLRAMIERRRAHDEDFRWQREAATLVIYEAATHIAEHLCRENGWRAGTVEQDDALRAIENLRGQPMAQQEARIPDLEGRQSASSLRESYYLAHALLVDACAR